MLPGDDLLGEVQPQRQMVPILKREGLLDHPDVLREQIGLRDWLRLQAVYQLESLHAGNQELELIIPEARLVEDLQVCLVNL